MSNEINSFTTTPTPTPIPSSPAQHERPKTSQQSKIINEISLQPIQRLDLLKQFSPGEMEASSVKLFADFDNLFSLLTTLKDDSPEKSKPYVLASDPHLPDPGDTPPFYGKLPPLPTNLSFIYPNLPFIMYSIVRTHENIRSQTTQGSRIIQRLRSCYKHPNW